VERHKRDGGKETDRNI
jgi:hypothetical protein